MKLTHIDIHSHLNLSPLYDRRDEILERMRDDGIGTITVGTGLQTSQRAVEIAEQNPGLCWATVGVHPCDCDDQDNVPDEWSQICRLATHPSVVAIGETGLDYFHDDTPEMRDVQAEVFKKHIELAVSVNKPLMLHVRSSRGSDDAYYDALGILEQYSSPLHGAPLQEELGTQSVKVPPLIEEVSKGRRSTAFRANFHFFSGSCQCMQDIVAAGYTVSVDGPITFVAEYETMIAACPLNKLMIETDAPYAAPKPYRGKTCEPWMVVHVAERIAEIKGLPLEMVQLQLLQNSKDFFEI